MFPVELALSSRKERSTIQCDCSVFMIPALFLWFLIILSTTIIICSVLVVEHAYQMATGHQRRELVSEFYSPEFRLFKGVSVTELDGG